MPFNFSKKFDFLPEISFPDSDPLEVIYLTRLLGFVLSSNLSWQDHVDDICLRSSKKLWVLVRFKELGASADQLTATYTSRIRSTLEFGAPVFTGALTKTQCNQIEMIQKKALAIILGRNYGNYDNALSVLNLERLDKRRTELSLQFALKCTRSPKHSWMFPPNPYQRENARHPKPFLERQCHTARHYWSPIPYLTRLLNDHFSKLS